MNSEQKRTSAANQLVESGKSAGTYQRRIPNFQHTSRLIVILGPQLIPSDILEEGLLTPCDQREIVVDHITRTSDVVFHLCFVKAS